MDVIETEFKFLEELKSFIESDLQKRKEALVEFERQMGESTPPQLNVLNDYLKYLGKHIIYIRDRLKQWGIPDQPQSYYVPNLKKMKSLHELRINHYSRGQENCKFLVDYLKFCKNCNAISDAKAFLIEVHPSNIHRWMSAAAVLLNDLNDEKSAINFLITAANYNKDNEIIYKQILRIKLDAAANSSKQTFIRKCTDELEDVLKKQIKEEHSMKCAIEILELISGYTFTTSLRNLYVEHVVAKFSDSADIWHYVAQKELKESDVRVSGPSTSEGSNISDDIKFQACLQLYKRGFDSVCDSDKPRLWFEYIDFLFTVSLDKKNNYNKNDKCMALKSALENGHSYISEQQFLTWFSRLNIEDNKDIVLLALHTHPYSEKLWRARMYFESVKNQTEAINTVFHQGRAILQENSLLLWDYFITYHCSYSDQETIRNYFEEGLRQHANIAQKLKPIYLEWIIQTEDITAGRKLYSEISSNPPFCKELHLTMLRLEQFQASRDSETIHGVFQLACSQFENDLDLRRAFMEFQEQARLHQQSDGW